MMVIQLISCCDGTVGLSLGWLLTLIDDRFVGDGV